MLRADRRILNAAVAGGSLLLVATFARPLLQRAGFADAPQDGLERLRARLGSFAPDGRGVSVLQVEASDRGGGWSLNTKSGRFRDIPVDPLAPNPLPSVHADMVANAMLSMAPGVSRICTASSDWFLTTLLGAGRPDSPGSLPLGTKIVFCAWVATAGAAADNDVLRRADWLVARSPFTLVAGQKNASALMGCAYNAIAVGPANGPANRGVPSGLDGSGRCKPDMVTSEGAASPATGRVAGAAAALLDAASRLPNLKDDLAARRPETIKAVLLAGAVRAAGWTNLDDVPGAPPFRATAQPLDRTVGAGRLDIARAAQALAAGRPSSERAFAGVGGWDLVTWSDASGAEQREVTYRIEIERDAGELAVVCCWNRQVLDAEHWALSDVDLRVERIGPEAADEWAASGNFASESRVDNVEMLLLRDIKAGEYRLTISLRDGAPVATAISWLVSGPSRRGAASPAVER